ncbi:hypothetical protein TREMEDRAFT_62902 [Tremella mesenterica DSM 1558]|uniref:uncharacterized protein n=1 Tax=Tremella mesenterica (strain ATCC 24925 / CBS 8224 / DSM 1558 / NBRC 9311 / NRRL Y-6157 / RJB 2259-6 / UBC 559-6) TaxID=578456 RepID=UPI0003F4A3A6|nr:uncharacterized protein TREMEDRAFT_62902 [Tremella mesenterica DSM 1558]EIW69178.1 hypothetical protein TREMEDRAFT_62902 [Tremella mesenterica DSM 1558]
MGNAPTTEELQARISSLEKEWQISEDLLAESQRDNESKQRSIEELRSYIKVNMTPMTAVSWLMERRKWRNYLRPIWGPTGTWASHKIQPPPRPSSVRLTASTPLPPPTPNQLRHSTSVTFTSKRASKSHFRRVSAFDLSPLHGISEGGDEIDSTPTGALKKLVYGSPLPHSSADTPPGQGHKLVITSQTPHQDQEATPKTSRIAMGSTQGPGTEPISEPLMIDLLASLNSLPSRIIDDLSVRGVTAEKWKSPRSDTGSVKLEKLITTAERRASNREAQLRVMLSNAMTAAKQIGVILDA